MDRKEKMIQFVSELSKLNDAKPVVKLITDMDLHIRYEYTLRLSVSMLEYELHNQGWDKRNGVYIKGNTWSLTIAALSPWTNDNSRLTIYSPRSETIGDWHQFFSNHDFLIPNKDLETTEDLILYGDKLQSIGLTCDWKAEVSLAFSGNHRRHDIGHALDLKMIRVSNTDVVVNAFPGKSILYMYTGLPETPDRRFALGVVMSNSSSHQPWYHYVGVIHQYWRNGEERKPVPKEIIEQAVRLVFKEEPKMIMHGKEFDAIQAEYSDFLDKPAKEEPKRSWLKRLFNIKGN